MRFSLIVMTYNRPAVLERCLASISALAYDPERFEVIVIDDGSDPEHAPRNEAAAHAHGAAYSLTAHEGVAAARNAGLSLAAGEFTAFLADDYTLPPTYLRKADSFFADHPDAQLVTFNMRSAGPSPARHVQQLYMELVLLGNAAAEPDADGVIRSFRLPASRAAVFRREVFERVGPFDATMMGGEDGEMGERLAKHEIPVYFLPNFFIDHWEDKNFAQFLGQRSSYATSYYELWSRNHPDTPRPYWTKAEVTRRVVGRLRPWIRLSLRNKMFVRFVALSPGLALFIGRFFWTLHLAERNERS